MKTPKTLHLAVVLLIGGAALADNDPPRPTVIEFRRGDVNSDGLIDDLDVYDFTFYLTYGCMPSNQFTLDGYPYCHPLCEDAADVNDDGVIDAADLFTLAWAAWMDEIHSAIPEPGPWCGPDPTLDTLSCVQGWCR